MFIFIYCRINIQDIFFFFFSSRRRHTRYIGDWSSDVCSSDLAAEKKTGDELEMGKGGGAGPRGKGSPGGDGPTPPKKPPGAFSLFMEKILDEARKDPT